MTVLKRYTDSVRHAQLEMALERATFLPVESIGAAADFTGIRETFARLLEETSEGAERSFWDARLVEPLHQALVISRRQAADMRLWHWLCISELQDIVWERWHGKIPGNLAEALTESLAGRFLGTATLNGVSRNALARLWWCGETLKTGDGADPYLLARKALERQDLFQAIFEREFGLYPPAARACLKKYQDAPAKQFRRGTRMLNHYLTTIAIESLTESDILEILP